MSDCTLFNARLYPLQWPTVPSLMGNCTLFNATAAMTVIFLVSMFSCLSDEKRDRVGLLFEGHFEKIDIASRVEGAKKTHLAAAYEWKFGVRLFTDESWKKRGLDWETFSFKAAKLADHLAETVKPSYVRNARGVIDYAIVQSEDPFISSAITSPNFLKKFANTLGNKIHVVIVDRNVLYVFPASETTLAGFAPALVEIFKKTPMPVSLEVFQVDKNGFRVIGEIERPTKAQEE